MNRTVVTLLLGLALVIAWAIWPHDAPVPPPANAGQGPTNETVANASATVDSPTTDREEAPALDRQPASTSAPDGSRWPQGVQGRVVDLQQRPVGGAKVLLLEASENLPALMMALRHGVPLLPTAEGVTDADGRFQLGVQHPTGQRLNEVRVQATGFAEERVHRLEIQPGDWHDVGDIIVQPGVTIRGRVVLEGTDLPVPGAQVTLRSGVAFDEIAIAGSTQEAARIATVDAAGRYELRDAPRRGLCALSAEAPGFARVTRARIDLASKPVIEVDFPLPRGLMIQGDVVDPDGQPIASAVVEATALQGNHQATFAGFTDGNGHFRVIGLTEGKYRLRTTATRHQPKELDGVAGGDTVRVMLDRRASARVRVLDPHGRPLARFSVGIRRWFQPPAHGSLPQPAEGSIGNVPQVPDRRLAQADLVDGCHHVHDLDPGTYVFQAHGDGYAKTLSEPFTLDHAAEVPTIELRLRQGGTLIGQVLDGNGRPLAGATVTTQPDGANEDNALYRTITSMVPDKITRAQVTTGADGTFVLPRLAHAGYQLAIVHPDHCAALVPGLQVQADGTQRLPPVTLVRGALVRGVVRKDGVPSGQIKVVMAPPAEVLAAPEGRQPAVRVETVTMSDGSYQLPRRVPPGVYELRCAQQGGPEQKIDIFVTIAQLRDHVVTVHVAATQELLEQDLQLTTVH